MEAFAVTLEVLRFIAVVALLVVILVGLAYVAVQVKEEISYMKTMSRFERRKRRADDDAFFTKMLDDQRKWLHTPEPLW